MRKQSYVLCYLLGLGIVFPAIGQKNMEAWQVADRLIESLGGRTVWASTKTLYVRELAFPSSIKDSVIAEFWRDLEKPAYKSIIKGSSIHRETRWSENEGWIIRNGIRTEMQQEALQSEISNWYQEPYVMYHKLAIRDKSLHLKLVDKNRLEIFDGVEGSLLCWFVVDASGALLRWGNYYKGEISEHVYGPIKHFGAFKMPAWGTSTTGSWRFEYQELQSLTEPLDIKK